MPLSPSRIHGGPGAAGAARHDFSTNANAAGPCPAARDAALAADASRYPDPGYTALRRQLAQRHGVAPGRIWLAASASEAIFRLTARAAQRGLRRVRLPVHAYGDYAQAADAWSLLPDALDGVADQGVLAWHCDPSSPLGQGDLPPVRCAALKALDRAYAPLRLSGTDPWSGTAADAVWQIWSPNKALGLTGVRAAYGIAPPDANDEVAALERLAPSWPVGAHGVALLDAWCTPEVGAWLHASLDTLRTWKASQAAICTGLGWAVLPSDTNFFCARPPVRDLAAWLRQLRGAGVQLRDCASFGLPGHVRLAVLPPASQQALADAVRAAAPSFPGDTLVPA